MKLYPDSVRGVVNCAGIGMAMLTLDRKGNAHDLWVFEHVLRINTTGTFDVCRLVAAIMCKLPPVGERAEGPASGGGERGVLINVASLAGIEGQDGQAAYGASKAAVIGMTLPMAGSGEARNPRDDHRSRLLRDGHDECGAR